MNKNNKKSIEIWTDGSCSGNPGPGATACLMEYRKKERLIAQKTFSKREGEHESNNKMELVAVLRALELLKPSAKGCNITIHTDSNYVYSIYNTWLSRWKMSGMTTKSGSKVKFKDIILKVENYISKFHAKIVWNKRSKEKNNKRVNSMAQIAAGVKNRR